MHDQALKDLLDLLKIDGPPSQEAEVAAFLRQALIEIGLAPADIFIDRAQEQSEYGGDTGNLIARIDGKRPGPPLLFSTHMDTVPDAVGSQPRLDQTNRRIVNDASGTALGGDNRTGCAALLHLARNLMCGDRDHRPLVLAFFIQEEVGLVGARGVDLVLFGAPDMGFNIDGGRPDHFVTSVIGTQRFTIDISGLPAHAGSRPQEGVSAAVIAARALADLDRDGWHGKIGKDKNSGSANVGTLSGGQGTNIVMPTLHLLAEARAHDPAFRRHIIDTWKTAFSGAVTEVANSVGQMGSVSFGPGPTYEAFALTDEEPVVQIALAAAKACGIQAQTLSNDGGMDANWIVAHGINTVTFGAGQRQVHTADEWIDLDDFERACDLVLALVGQASE